MSRKVLVIRLSAIGDCIMTAWPVTAMRKGWPDARIDWAIQPRCSAAIACPDLVDWKQLFRRDAWRGKVWSPRIWQQQISYHLRLRHQKYDIGLDFQGHLKAAFALWATNPKQRLSLGGSDEIGKRLNPVYPSKSVHSVERGMDLINHLDNFTCPERPIMPAFKAERAAVQKAGRLVTIQTGAGGPNKAYAPEKWNEVSQELMGKGWQVAAIGGPNDPHIACSVDLVGKLSLAESLAWVAESDLHLAADTGTGHAAAAYGVPVVSIFGPMEPEKFRPWTMQGRVLHRGKSPNNIAPQEVLEAARNLVGGL